MSVKGLAEHLKNKYINPLKEDMLKVRQKLEKENRINYTDPNTLIMVKAKHKSQELISIYKNIRKLIIEKQYVEAVNSYYMNLGNKYYGELTNEFIYLKRLAKIPLSGRDLFYFRKESSRTGIIASYPDEYVFCIDETLLELQKMERESPLDLLLEYAPTMEQMIENRKYDWHMGVFLWKGEFKRDSTPVTLDKFTATYDSCPEGRIFDRYPNQVQHCRVIEYRKDPKFMGLWTKCSPSYHKTEILDKGFYLRGIEAYRHKSWREYKGKCCREPEFISLQSLDEVSSAKYGTHGIEYTGRSHQVNGQSFYEINLLRKNDGEEVIENPFIELVEEILREAENLLREKHGIPRIGEGWISEMQLFRLLQIIFPDAKQHASPHWLKPQHLDVFIPSRELAFEYQGKQHYEPIDFFGGQESFESTVKRDKLKTKKCIANGIILIQWHYTESIDKQTLKDKLTQAGVIGA